MLAIAAQIPSVEIGRSYFQETHPQNLFQECSHYCEMVSSPDQLPGVLETAIRVAVAERGVSVIVLPGDVGLMAAPEAAKLSPCLLPAPALVRPQDRELDKLAKLLNESSRVTLLCGRGCFGAHAPLMRLAEALKSPIVHALGGKEGVEWENPYDVGMTGLIGFSSGYHAMLDRDMLLRPSCRAWQSAPWSRNCRSKAGTTSEAPSAGSARFALLCGVGLCAGYALLGAAWLCSKTVEEVRDFGYRLLPWLLGAVLLFLLAAFAYALGMNLRVLHRWVERPVMLLLPVIGVAACAGVVIGIRRSDALLFPMSALIFGAAFATLAASFLPYMVPFSVTLQQAASPHSSLAFMFWGAGVVVLPITLIYTLMVYWVFKGKIAAAAEYN